MLLEIRNRAGRVRVDVRVLFHALSTRVCLDISKVQDWELVEDPQSSSSAWVQLLRKGAECAQAMAGTGHPAQAVGSFAVGRR